MSTARTRRQRWQQTVPLRELLEARIDFEGRLRDADDRRYAEVNVEREKALKIKETADLAALQLAREIQTYKDEKANELREQINRERGLYATHDDVKAVSDRLEALIQPLTTFVNAQQGSRQSGTDSRAVLTSVLGVVVVFIAIGSMLIAILKP
jgi:vacuolar-type H+-ATPase subunit H